MKLLNSFLTGFAAILLLAGCETMHVGRTTYDRPAYAPKNPNNVRVDVSLNKKMVYVMEGNRPLLVTATAIGTAEHPTPRGHFTVFNKIKNKRSGSYGFWVRGGQVVAADSSHRPSGIGWRYIGFPMGYWVEFAPGYGFHEGSVWPVPRTHGCLRMHKNDAADFFSLVKDGTPVNIANSQPEDATLGENFQRPQDYNDPDPPAAFYASPEYFETIKAAEIIKGS